jgi:hypothetical protein
MRTNSLDPRGKTGIGAQVRFDLGREPVFMDSVLEGLRRPFGLLALFQGVWLRFESGNGLVF